MDCNTRTVPVVFDFETVAIRKGGLGFGEMRYFRWTEARKALEFPVQLVFGFLPETLYVGFFTRRATR
ncbi:hypothetical protein [Pseudomonas sp. RGM2987]|uniref:hypothetical protein n=1 Tax=Pseudomonas sp. RGM2987 TaxID=2930090 RepID=UPI001FD6E486|nr:hypothetical protein [Pseudomonas sp. RGM2987]MCJ8205654.1 hypothetical protein [Pseudomonas sp. RGM2987]